MASPDWLKFALILSPCLTLISLAGIWARVKMHGNAEPAKERGAIITIRPDDRRHLPLPSLADASALTAGGDGQTAEATEIRSAVP